MTFLKNFINDEEGQDLVEYALLIGFVALASILALTTLGTTISAKFDKATSSLS